MRTTHQTPEEKRIKQKLNRGTSLTYDQVPDKIYKHLYKRAAELTVERGKRTSVSYVITHELNKIIPNE